MMYNPINLAWQYLNGLALLNMFLGIRGPETLSCSESYKHSGIFLYLKPKVDLSHKQYFITFKAETWGNLRYREFQIYHNSNLVSTRMLNPDETQFAMVVDCDHANPTYLFFKLANLSFPLFHEIEFDIISK
jgi:hypothetical protein